MEDTPPHFRTTTHLFICFTSRLSSSSSMKISKSILSPARVARDPSLSTSLSRRLRTNGSLKGSPFTTTTTGKKRGCAFDNPEPSSPKVTCIGQVRVKTKNKVKQTRNLSRRRSAGEVSFRKAEDEDKAACSLQQQQQQQRHSNASVHYQQPPHECAAQHRSQKWVHLPVSICEALRAFGAEFSCLFPCKSSSCFSTAEREKDAESKQRNENGCGAVFARWLVSMNDDEGGKKQEIELVVGGEDEEETTERIPMRSSRRHVFEDIEVKDDRIELKGQSVTEVGQDEATAARVSICIPPKNALLLMRCRSDPMKMATLTGRFSWDAHAAPAPQTTEKNIQEEDEFDEEKNDLDRQEQKETAFVHVEPATETDEFEAETISEMEAAEGEQLQQEVDLAMTIAEMVEREVEQALHCECIHGDDDHEETLLQEDEAEEVESNMSSFEALLDQEIAEPNPNCAVEDNDEDEQDIPTSHFAAEPEADEAVLQDTGSKTPQEDTGEEHETTYVNDDPEAPDPGQQVENPEIVTSSNEEEPQKAQLEKPAAGVPECLLLMMCEPKLSMEVSKETWVCSTDFIRWLPEQPRRSAKATKLCDRERTAKPRLSIDSKPKAAAIIPHQTNNIQHQQPPRSSCTLPAPASMTAMIEQKLVNAVGYEPFVLTRCKSEPMRTAATKLVPESCFWKHSMAKLAEPHRRATLGVGAAGIGF